MMNAPVVTPPSPAGDAPVVVRTPGAPATPPPATTPPPSVLPPPSSYLSSAWNVWPHAWAYVPNLWSAWHHDFLNQSRPATPAERVGTEPSIAPRVDQPETTPTAPVVVPPTQIASQELPVLPAPRLVRRRRYNLIISGIGLLVATWAADRLLASSLSPKPETWLPLVGPWFLLGQQSNLATPSPQIQGLLVVDGLLQAGGLSMTLLGLILSTKQYIVTVKPLPSDLIPREAP
jgi:hypothetical protein